MKKIKIYLDTSVINFLFADDAPEKKEVTVTFFNTFISASVYENFISPFVIEEILQTTNENKKGLLLNAVSEYPLEIVDINNMMDEINTLSDAYIKAGAVPETKKMDALHVALCTLMQIDYLVSWNFKHLANINRERKFLIVNQGLNYAYPLRIVTPENLFNDEYGN